jgi:cysteinyl-tRNA synthetase
LRTALQFLGFSCDRAAIRRRPPTQVIQASRFDSESVFFPPTVIDHNRVNGLVEARSAARAAKNFKEADRIRDELAAMGVTLKDAKDPKTGELVTTWELAR